MNELQRIRALRKLEQGTLGIGQAAPVVMCYPSPYRVGMSSLGFQTLYRQLNEDGPGAHRAFLPDEWEKQSLAWPQPRRKILSIEGERPVSDYPILAFSVAYELEITGLIRFLEGTGIPLLAAHRGPRDPIIIAGGPLTNSNGSVLLPFVDLLIAGEAEQVFPEVVEILLGSGSRESRILSAGAGIHVAVGELESGIYASLPKCAVAPRHLIPAHSAITTPNTELSNMFLVEPERGCSRDCTFCVMRGPTTGGMRLVDADHALALVPEHARKVGLVGAAVTDHPRLEEIVASIVDSGRGIGISSLRADRLTPTFLRNLDRAGYRTITVASDGISQRIRDHLSRRIKEEDLLRAAKLIRTAGFHRMKLYQMIGVPGEDESDVDELIRFVRELAGIMRITMTISTFVAKRNTPLDGTDFIGVKQASGRLARIRAGLKGKADMRPQPPKWAHIEYLLARSGPEAGHASIEAVHAGASYSDWTRAFRDVAITDRALVFGDEERRAKRSGHAARRSHLPVLRTRS